MNQMHSIQEENLYPGKGTNLGIVVDKLRLLRYRIRVWRYLCAETFKPFFFNSFRIPLIV
jgi:hypothetical protein